jgi:hypothetical protein
VRQEKFNVISLPIPKAFTGMVQNAISFPNLFFFQSLTLETLLRRYFISERIDGASCDQCQSRGRPLHRGLIRKMGIAKVSTSLFPANRALAVTADVDSSRESRRVPPVRQCIQAHGACRLSGNAGHPRFLLLLPEKGSSPIFSL